MESNHDLLSRCLRLSLEIDALINTNCDSALLHDASMRLRYAMKEINRRVLSIENQMGQSDSLELAGGEQIEIREGYNVRLPPIH